MADQGKSRVLEDRLGEIVFAYVLAREEGRAPNPHAWLASYPEYETELAAFLEGQAELDRVAGPLREVGRAAWSCSSVPDESETTVIETADRPSNPAARCYGDYEVIEEIAHGGMGIVYKARQKSLNRPVALKVIRAGEMASSADVRRFRREAETVALLDHPHIVPIYEVGEADGQVYFSMKLIEGGRLADQGSKRQPAVSETDQRTVAKRIMVVAKAIHHAHQRGVLHRDLKPSNILLDCAGEPHVTDFGLAKRVETDNSLTLPGVVLGTPTYMAPEQAAGELDKLAPSADVYALGAVFYELLTGRPPFQGRTPLEILEQVRSREPLPPRRACHQIPQDLETICLKCLEKKPAQRYASAQLLADDLERWLRDEPIVARPHSWAERTRRFARRHRSKLFAAGMVVFAVAAAIVMPILLRGPSADVLEQRRLQQALESQQASLAAGKAVELIGHTGAPAYFRWETSGDQQAVHARPDSPFAVSAKESGLLELVPDPGRDSYRFRVDVRQDATQGIVGKVGVYFAHTPVPFAQGNAHYFFVVPFNDLAEEALVHPTDARKVNWGRFLHKALVEPSMDSFAFQFGVGWSFIPIGRKAEVKWRRLQIDVRSRGIELWWDGQQVGKLSRDELEKYQVPKGLYPELPDSNYSPRGGLGLYVRSSVASFRDALIEPLADDK